MYAAGLNPTRSEINEAMASLDSQESYVSYEFIQNVYHNLSSKVKDPLVFTSQIKAALRQFDHEGLGMICEEDLIKLLTGTGDALTKDQVYELLSIFKDPSVAGSKVSIDRKLKCLLFTHFLHLEFVDAIVR